MYSMELVIHLLTCVLFIKVSGQLSGQLRYAVKSGSCPPSVCVSVFDSGCQSDFTCPREMKCCANQCGKQMCMPPITSEQRKRKQENLHVSFVQETTPTTDQCFYNGQWYNPGQNLINRDGAQCTCINRERISCTRQIMESNNINAYYNNQGQPNAVQSNVPMAQSAWQAQFTTPAYQWNTQTTSQPVQVYIQDVNNIPIGRQAQQGAYAAMNSYQNLGEVSGTQSPAFFQANHVKEAQAHSVITGQNSNMQQMLYDKNYPSVEKSASVNNVGDKSEMNGQFGVFRPYMSGNVNFGLPRKNEGNVLMGPLTTEVSIVKDAGVMEMRQSGQGIMRVNQGFGSTTSSWLANTGVSKNIVESLQFGALERQAGQQSFPKNDNSGSMQNSGYTDQQQNINPGSTVNQEQISSFKQEPVQRNSNAALSTHQDLLNMNSQRQNSFDNSQIQFQANNQELQQQIGMPPTSAVQAPFQSETSKSQKPIQQTNKEQGSHQQMTSIEHLKRFQSNPTNGFFGFSPNSRMQEKVNSIDQKNVQASFGSFGANTNGRNINSEPSYQSPYNSQGNPQQNNYNPNLDIPQQTYPINSGDAPNLGSSRQTNPTDRNNNRFSRIPQQTNQMNPYNNPYSGIQQQANVNNPNFGIPKQTYPNERQSNPYFGIPQQNIDQSKNRNQNNPPQNLPMYQNKEPQSGYANSPTQERNDVPHRHNSQADVIHRSNQQDQNTGIQPLNTGGRYQDGKPFENTGFNANNLLVNQNKANQVFDKRKYSRHSSQQANKATGTESRKFVYNARHSNNIYKVISFESMRNEKDLRLINRQRSRVTPFSLKGESIKVEDKVPQSERVDAGLQTDAPSTSFPEISKVKINSDTQKPFEEIIIETTLPPATSTQSFLQFLKEVLDQREMVKSKAESPAEIVYNKEMVKSKKEAQQTTNPISRKTSSFKKAPSSRIETASTTTTTTTTKRTTFSSSLPSTAAITTVSSVKLTPNSIPTTTEKGMETQVTGKTSENYNDAKPRTLKSILRNIDNYTTVRIKVVPTQNVSPDTSQTYVVYMSPSPKQSHHESTSAATSTVPTTTFTYVNNQNQQQTDITDKLTMLDPKEPRIQIVTESTTMPVITTLIEKPATSLRFENLGQKSQGTTNSHYSHFQFTDTATQRMDIVDQSKDITINNPTTTMMIPIGSTTNQLMYQETPIVYTGNSRVQNAGSRVTHSSMAQMKDEPKIITSDRHVPDVLPENATFYEKIVFMRRQKEARENPVAALKKYGSQSNMLHLINMLPKNNYNPMAAKNVAEYYTVKDRQRFKTTATRTTPTTPNPVRRERKMNNAITRGTQSSSKTKANIKMIKNRNTPVVQKSTSRSNVLTRNNRKLQVQRPQKPQNRPRAQTAKKSAAKSPVQRTTTVSNKRLKQKKNNKQCVYLGKIYKIGQRFRNSKGQRCRCRKGGKIKCRR